ncbi:hypothetical protein D1872_173980 [compost metagenome]
MFLEGLNLTVDTGGLNTMALKLGVWVFALGVALLLIGIFVPYRILRCILWAGTSLYGLYIFADWIS